MKRIAKIEKSLEIRTLMAKFIALKRIWRTIKRCGKDLAALSQGLPIVPQILSKYFIESGIGHDSTTRNSDTFMVSGFQSCNMHVFND